MRLLLFALIVTFTLPSNGQDMQYSQFYASPLYLNPAMAGANACSRISTSYRQQWPGVSGKFSSYVLSYDHMIPNRNSAFGIMVNNQQAGTGKLGSTTGSLIYAYQLSWTKKWTFNAGFEGSYTHQKINFYDLTFVDQLVTGSASTIEIPLLPKQNYFDFSTGAVAFTRTFYAGFAAHHLTTPNVGIVSSGGSLPVKYSIHSGLMLPVKSGAEGRRNVMKENFTPSFSFYKQGKFQTLDLGFYYTNEPVTIGVWYRGIPVLRTVNEHKNSDAFIVIAGFTKDRFKFGYSYDVPLSLIASTTRGSHEISLSYQFCDYAKFKNKRRVIRFVPCAKF